MQMHILYITPFYSQNPRMLQYLPLKINFVPKLRFLSRITGLKHFFQHLLPLTLCSVCLHSQFICLWSLEEYRVLSRGCDSLVILWLRDIIPIFNSFPKNNWYILYVVNNQWDLPIHWTSTMVRVPFGSIQWSQEKDCTKNWCTGQYIGSRLV